MTASRSLETDSAHMTEFADEARKEANDICLDVERYRLAEAVQKVLDFPQSFFVHGSPAYQSFRDATVSLSERYNRAHDLTGELSKEARDHTEDEIVRDLVKLTHRMASAAQQSTKSTLQILPPRPSRPIVVLDECRKEFDGFSLGPINFSIYEGDVLALMGPNASGKSTLLRLILGEIAASRGGVIYKGLPPTWSFRGNRSNIGYVPQFPPSWKGSLRQNLHYYLSIRGVRGKENQKRVEYYLHRFGLTPYQDKPWGAISGGYRLRVALARELLMEPHLLILDEPLAHLDVESQFILLDIIKSVSIRYQQPMTVVLTSQHIYETERFATKVIVLGGDGKALAQGALSELNKHGSKVIYELEMDVTIDALRRAFGGMQCEIRGRPPVFIVEFSNQQTIENVLSHLSERGMLVKAIRNISQSSRSYFRILTKASKGCFRRETIEYMSNNYRLVILFPRLWQTRALGAGVYAMMSAVVSLIACSTVVSGMTSSSIPESIFLWPKSFIFASIIATLFWIFRSSYHFRVGVLGYKIAPPRFILLLIVFGLLWVAPVTSNYYVSQKLRSLATADEAGIGYLRLQRFSALFNANTHYEPLKLQVEIQQLESPDRFSVSFIRELASTAIRPIEVFAPIALRGSS